ncbi:MAG: hypothetical protein GX444_03455 [Myxococcales bacterium]|nr:hypothetical protein [Myxococcales bacterium]
MNQRLVAGLLGLMLCLTAGAAWAGFTETLPQGAFMLDVSYLYSYLNSAYDDDGRKVPLIEEVKRYEPGAGLQGTLIPKARTEFGILVSQLQYGIFDNLSAGIGVPVVLYTKIDPDFQWDKGDYNWNLGRSYSEQDFWDWAGSMGQPKPGKWRGNEGVLGDIQLGTRWRFTDGYQSWEKLGLAMAGMMTVALPTGKQPDPEEVVTAGTTSWDLHSNGDLGFHVSLDKSFKESLDGRLLVGVDAFYEFLLPHRYESPEGKKNPLLLNYRPFTGKYYTIDGGDFTGGSVQTDIVPWKGPALGTWLTKGDVEKAKALPPLLTFSFRYSFIYLQQTDWQSDSEIWDYDRERLWRPGYKNMLNGQMVLSLLRLGAPLQPYVAYRNLTWIPGKNCRAADVLSAGTRVLMKFW